MVVWIDKGCLRELSPEVGVGVVGTAKAVAKAEFRRDSVNLLLPVAGADAGPGDVAPGSWLGTLLRLAVERRAGDRVDASLSAIVTQSSLSRLYSDQEVKMMCTIEFCLFFFLLWDNSDSDVLFGESEDRILLCAVVKDHPRRRRRHIFKPMDPLGRWRTLAEAQRAAAMAQLGLEAESEPETDEWETSSEGGDWEDATTAQETPEWFGPPVGTI